MGAYVNFKNRVEFLSKKWNELSTQYSFSEIDESITKEIVEDKTIHTIQISETIPEDLLVWVDKIFEVRPDITFRIYGFYNQDHTCDLSFLNKLPHIQRISIDYLRNVENLSVLENLSLKSLRLYVFDLKDYAIIKNLYEGLEELSISHEISGKIHFDCNWLLKYKNLKTLYLGKASQNIESVTQMEKLEELVIRGSKIKDLSFLKESKIKNLKLHWCSMEDLSSLSGNKNIESLELWRILKLNDLDFISTLSNLKYLFLQDLANITSLCEVKDTSLESIYIDNLKKLENVDSLKEVKTLRKVEMVMVPKLSLESVEKIYQNEAIQEIEIRGIGNKKRMMFIEELQNKYKK